MKGRFHIEARGKT